MKDLSDSLATDARFFVDNVPLFSEFDNINF